MRCQVRSRFTGSNAEEPAVATRPTNDVEARAATASEWVGHVRTWCTATGVTCGRCARRRVSRAANARWRLVTCGVVRGGNCGGSASGRSRADVNANRAPHLMQRRLARDVEERFETLEGLVAEAFDATEVGDASEAAIHRAPLRDALGLCRADRRQHHQLVFRCGVEVELAGQRDRRLLHGRRRRTSQRPRCVGVAVVDGDVTEVGRSDDAVGVDDDDDDDDDDGDDDHDDDKDDAGRRR